MSNTFCFLPLNYKSKEIVKQPDLKQEGKSFIARIDILQPAPSLIDVQERLEPQKSKRRPKASQSLATKNTLDIKENSILDIDKTIRTNFLVEKQNLPLLREQLKLSQRLSTKSNEENVEYISHLRKKIKDIESSSSVLLYTLKTYDLIEEYKNHMLMSSNKNFITNASNSESVREASIIFKYIGIAQLYLTIDGITQIPKKMTCDACGSSSFTLSYEDESIYICKVCSTEREILDDAPSFKDTDRVNMSSKYTYTRKGHFIDAIKKFQGTQNTDPKKIKYVTDVLHKEIEKHNLCPKQGAKNSVSKDHIYTFLSEQDLSFHYDDINLLFHIVTGEACPDVSHILDGLFADFDKLEEVLSRIKDENRSNSLTVNYKLYKLLQKKGFPCRKNDFYILKTKTKEDEHDEKMKEAWKILGWDWIPTF